MRPNGAGSGTDAGSEVNTEVERAQTRDAPNSARRPGDDAPNPTDDRQPLPDSGRSGCCTGWHCPRDTNTCGTEMATKAVRQARLELSGGSAPDL